MRLFPSTLLILTPLTAMADVGNHVHPHGMEYGWILAAALGLGAGFVLARWRK
jgi:hypothetical protein